MMAPGRQESLLRPNRQAGTSGVRSRGPFASRAKASGLFRGNTRPSQPPSLRGATSIFGLPYPGFGEGGVCGVLRAAGDGEEAPTKPVAPSDTKTSH